MLVDSHCHLDGLDLVNYGGDVTQAIAAARQKGVKYILAPGVKLETFPDILKIVEHDDALFAAVGVHPTEEATLCPTLDEIIILGQNKKVVGIGETGLDFYQGDDASERLRQTRLFKLHIQAARELNKPLIVHAREVETEIIEVLTSENAASIGGVMHCFTGSLAMAQAALEMDFYISFSGIITFRNAENLRSIAKQLPLDKILIETDAPYLAPTPMRGKPNEPAYLPYIAEFMAKLLGVSYEDFSNLVTENFWRFCGF